MRLQKNATARVRRFLEAHGLAATDEPLLVGVSGGPDSVCLLHILAGLRETLGLKLHVAHLNHLLRGAESDADAEYVAALARELEVPATVASRDVRAHQRKLGLSLEEAAREVRYAFFAEVARSSNTSTVAVGHTADDQVETLLMHLVRGTGLTGLRGMQPLARLRLPGGSDLGIARPLLEVRRAETEAYCAAQGLSPRSDSSNRWPSQLRNQVRSRLIPLLRQYNPDIDEALLRTARAADADLDYIDEDVLRIWDSVASERPDGVAIQRERFSQLHPSLQRHLIRSAFGRLLGDLRDIESVHVEDVANALAKPAGRRLSLPRGLAFHGDYEHGLISTGGSPACPLPPLEGECRLNVPGETWFCGWQVKAAITGHRPAQDDENGLKAYLDLDITGRELTMRQRKRGERFQPLGMESPKKLQDFMVDARIPRHWRDRVPLVCSPQQILWVVGWRIDHRARVTPSTRSVLRLEFTRETRA